MCPVVGLLGHMVILFLGFSGTSILFSVVAKWESTQTKTNQIKQNNKQMKYYKVSQWVEDPGKRILETSREGRHSRETVFPLQKKSAVVHVTIDTYWVPMECQALGTGDTAVPRPPSNTSGIIVRSAAVTFSQWEAKSQCKGETDHHLWSHKMNKDNNKNSN